MTTSVKNEKKAYLTVYTLEGHTTFRAHLGRTKDAIDREAKNNKWPKITSLHVVEIDLITGGSYAI